LESSRPQRARFRHSDRCKNKRHSNKAARLADLLREHRNSFPGFAARIDQFIAQVESDSKRSRSYDRDKVIELLRAWEFGLTVKELMEDTEYSHWDIRQILADLIKRGTVVRVEELRLGRRVVVYKLA
jgi:hypothetical protein